MLLKIVNGDFTAPRQRKTQLPSEFEELILKPMARDASDRFPSTRALGCALAAFASVRVQAEHAAELALEPRAREPQPEPGDLAAAAEMSTTLSASGPRSVAGRSRRGRLVLSALGVVVIAAVVLLARRQDAPPLEQERTLSASPAPAAPPERAEAPEPTPAAPVPQASPAAVPSTSSLDPPPTPPARPLQSVPASPSPSPRRRAPSAPPARNDVPVELPPLAPR
jgi:hypothetical protein